MVQRRAHRPRETGAGSPGDPPDGGRTGTGNLSDLLGELRVLLPGAQTLTAFLIILPFNAGFGQIRQGEKNVYLATFLCSIGSLILFAAPAAWHRLLQPLRDRERFKRVANRLIIAGLAFLSCALALATQIVIAEVAQRPWVGWLVAGAVAVLIVAIWWLAPLGQQVRGGRGAAP
jgi:hypothetical protein